MTPQVQPAAITRPSSLNVFDSRRLGSFERSPIRTLSEDRLHVSLRLGPLVSESESRDQEGENLPDLPILSKAEGKKKMVKPQGRKRVARSPPQGVNVKKRRITKPPTPPHRKLLMDAIVAGGRGLSGVSRGMPKSSRIIPPMAKKGKDFHPPQPSLP